ncbi:MAG: hypothetical protein AAGF12_33515 [Myxococcota bacterium]
MIRLLLLATPMAVVFAAPAKAQPEADAFPRELGLVVSPCLEPSLDWQGLHAQLSVELRALDVTVQTPAISEGSARLVTRRANCTEPSSDVVAMLVDPATQSAVERSISLVGADPEQRVRVVALALVEWLRQEWPSLSARSDFAPPYDPRPELNAQGELIEELSARIEEQDRALNDLASTTDGLEARQRSLERDVGSLHEEETLGSLLGARLSIRGFLSGGASAIGPAVGIELPLGPLRVAVDGSASWGGASHRLGDVPLVIFDGRLAISAPMTSGDLSVSIGALLSVGWVRAEGRPFDSSVGGLNVEGALVGFGGRAVVHIRLLDGLHAGVTIDAEQTVGGADVRAAPEAGLAERIVDVSGPALSVGIGLGYEL